MITMRLVSALDARGQVFVVLLLLICLALALANQIFAPDHPLHVSTFIISLFGKYLCYALLALSIDLVWGFCGVLSLGHGAFFAIGGYAMGMYLMRQIGTRGVYGDPILPDFMVFLNWAELPWYWYGFDIFAFAMLMALVAPAALAFVFGWLAFRSRVTGVYLSIITQAMTFALMLAFFRNDMGFGGNNGLTDFKEILGYDVQDGGTRVTLFLASALAVLGGYLLAVGIVRSKLGQVLVAVRDAEQREHVVEGVLFHCRVLCVPTLPPRTRPPRARALAAPFPAVFALASSLCFTSADHTATPCWCSLVCLTMLARQRCPASPRS